MTDQYFENPLEIFDHIDIAMVRDPRQYEYQKPYRDSTKGEDRQCIQLGAGFKLINGWRNLEYPEWNADYPIPAKGYTANDVKLWSHLTGDGTQPNNSVSEIASYHTLDHLSPQQVVQTLREIERVLIPGGTFTNIVPHFDSTLAKECIWHQSRFGIDTFRNIFSERQYSHDGEWNLSVGLNFIFGLAERNTVLVTQLIKGE